MTVEYVNRPRVAAYLEAALKPFDRLFNGLYGQKYNPLYHSGALAFWLLVLVTVTGIYLLLFYRVGGAYASLERINAQVWAGRWIRTLHRYASDAAVVVTLFHILRLMVQGRTWGPRMLAWVSGVVMLLFIFICGWTGYIMMWDVHGQVIVFELNRMLDLLPIFSEPINRAFISEETLPRSFFFLNLWIHVSVPLLMVLFLWIHTIRAARPQLTPPRELLWAILLLLTAVSIVWPATLPPAADLLALPGDVPIDWFYSFWLPLSRSVEPGVNLAIWVAFWVLGFTVPWWWLPARDVRGQLAENDEQLCTGCSQCYVDCPYEAIQMVPREAGKGSDLVSRITPSICVSCGLCAGSCAPMVIGVPGRTGRDQLREMERLRLARAFDPRGIVVFVCRNGIGAPAALAGLEGVHLEPINCGGELHTTVVEFLVRSGVGGVMVMACPERNCVHREGPKWLYQRFYMDREAELKPRVDRERVTITHFGASDGRAAVEEVRRFLAHVRERADGVQGEEAVELELECEPVEVSHG